MLHPSHFLTGWSHFHNRGLDTCPALSTALPKHLETICHLLHQHPTITLFPRHKPAMPAASPSPASNDTGQDQTPGTTFAYIEPRKQEDRAISPSVCLFVIEEQPNLTGPGSFTSSSRPSACFGYSQSTRPGELLHCRRAEHIFTQAQPDPQRQEVLTLAPQPSTLKLPSAVLRLGQSRAGPKQESPGADSRGTYCSSLEFTGMEVVQD